MRFIVARDVLAEAVSRTACALSVRPVIPILAGVRIQVETEELTLSSFDYKVSANSHISTTVEETNRVLVSGCLLTDISESPPNKPVTVELDGQKMKLTRGSSHFTLAVIPLDECPLLPAQPQAAGTVDSRVLSQTVSQMSIAVSRDDTLPPFAGVHMKIDGERVIFFATDHYCPATCKLGWTLVDPAFECIALVKARILQDAAEPITSGETVELGILDSSQQGASSLIDFEASDRRATSTLMDGDYPSVCRFLPRSTPIQAACDRHTFLETARRMPLVAERKASIRPSSTDGSLVLEAGQGDNAQAPEAPEMSLYGEDIATAFNPQLLIDGLPVMDTDYTCFGFTYPDRPVVMTGQTKADKGEVATFRYLLMSIRSGMRQMRVSYLTLDDFRSWKHAVLELPAGPPVFLGHNGQGKTNLVEAIAYLSTFFSHYVSAEGSLVRILTHEEEPTPARAFVRAKTTCDKDCEQVVEFETMRGKASRVRINRASVRPYEILGLVRTVVFAPEDLRLVRDDPSMRRAFLDRIAIQTYPLYAQVKANFDRVLCQRAAIMEYVQSQLRCGRTPDLSTIEVWNERFVELSARVSTTRFEAASLLSGPAARAYDDIVDSHCHLELSFGASTDRTVRTNPGDSNSDDLGDVEVRQRRLLAAFDRTRDQGIERGVDPMGAHRDDLSLKSGRTPVKGLTSRGESRSVAPVLRLGCFGLLRLDG